MSAAVSHIESVPGSNKLSAMSTQQSAGRTLNAMDEAMLSVCRSLQSLGAPGFETQTIVWLRDISPETLRSAIVELGRRFPAVCARLAPRAHGRAPFWRFRPDAEVCLCESHLQSAESTELLTHAAQLLSAPRDLTGEDPIRFHLIHLPDRHSAFIMQYSHALLDHAAAGLVLQQLDAIAAGRAGGEDAHAQEQQDLIHTFLSRFHAMRRLRAATRTWRHRMRGLRGEVAVLHNRARLDTHGVFRIVRRVLTERQTRAADERVGNAAGLNSVSMAVLGSLFRGIQQVAGESRNSRRRFVAGIGLDLGLRKGGRPIFQNAVSVVPVHASAAELEDRQSLTQTLTSQLRQLLANDLDLGVVELATLTRSVPRIVHRLTRRLLRDGYSLWYAYFGRLSTVKEQFCGAKVEDIAVVGPAWSGPGLTITVTRCRDRLAIQATHCPHIVSESLLERFLDVAIDDLAGIA